MNILSGIGLGGKKIRYAMVALGDITQEATLPGVAHTGNSEVTALVSGSPDKAQKVAEQYGVADVYGYDQFATMLASGTVDAIYLATPNWMHTEFAVAALRAGIHVLVEKPLEVTTAKAREIVDAQKASKAKLMVAYRLHFEPATLDAIETVRSGKLGTPLVFTSVFSQRVDPDNHRVKNGDLAGPLLDMGTYPLNAARYIFGDEPLEVISATGIRHPDAGYGDMHDTVVATLRFPEGKIAQFAVSYYGNALDKFTVLGTEGSLEMQPAFLFGTPLGHTVTIGEKKREQSFKNTDHFGGEMRYFSDCILHDRDPEPDAEEGYADVRVLEGIQKAVNTGSSVLLEPFTRTKRIETSAQLQTLSAVTAPDLVDVSNPSATKDKAPAN